MFYWHDFVTDRPGKSSMNEEPEKNSRFCFAGDAFPGLQACAGLALVSGDAARAL